jgi:hypothetical protein
MRTHDYLRQMRRRQAGFSDTLQPPRRTITNAEPCPRPHHRGFFHAITRYAPRARTLPQVRTETQHTTRDRGRSRMGVGGRDGRGAATTPQDRRHGPRDPGRSAGRPEPAARRQDATGGRHAIGDDHAASRSGETPGAAETDETGGGDRSQTTSSRCQGNPHIERRRYTIENRRGSERKHCDR